MDNVDFEGYMGLDIYDNSFSDDMMLVIVLIFLAVFAWIFRTNTPSIGKMMTNIKAGKQGQSIFETSEKNSFLFNSFMTFQAILLISIFSSSLAVRYKFITAPTLQTTLFTLGSLLMLLLIYFLLKRVLCIIPGMIFMEKSSTKMLQANYQASFSTWGIFLYLPVLLVLLFEANPLPSIIIFIFSYLLFKIVVSFRFIRIFYKNNTGFLFLSMYLCAQEVAPLVFLYQGIIFTYNIIERNYSWH